MLNTKHDQIVRVINRHLAEKFIKRSIFCDFLVDNVMNIRENSITFAPYNMYALHHISNGKVFILHAYNNKKEICNYICEKFGLKFIEKNYRKQYLCFETDNLDLLLTFCTLIN